MKRLRPDEIDYLKHPERFTFDYFREKTLDPLPEAAALGIADEELLNYYDNRYHKEGRFVLRLDLNDRHYAALEDWVAGAAYRIVGERMGDPEAFQKAAPEFTAFRVGTVNALHPYPELQKVQILKKIALELRIPPAMIDELAHLFSVGSSVFAMELFTRLVEAGRLEAFAARLSQREELARLSTRPVLLYTLWDHQKRALEAWLGSGGKGILEMATATGKTMVGLAAAEKLFKLHGSLRVLVLAHSRALLDQWRRETIEKLGFVGDPGKDYQNPLNYDDRFVVTFDTLQKVYKDPGAYAADLLIVDEVHHGAGLQFRKALEVPSRWKMGLSATVEGAERGQVLDRYLGKTVYTFTLKEAREQGVVPDFRLHVHRTFLDVAEDVEFNEISEHIKKLLNYINANDRERIRALSGHRFSRFESLGDFVKLMRDSRYLETEVPEEWQKLTGLIYRRRLVIHRSAPRMEQAIRLVKQLGDRKKCVVFSMDIETCERIYGSVKDTVNAYRVHSGLHPDDVKRALTAFRTCTTGVLIAPKMLDEGIDVPDAEIGINVASAKTPAAARPENGADTEEQARQATHIPPLRRPPTELRCGRGLLLLHERPRLDPGYRLKTRHSAGTLRPGEQRDPRPRKTVRGGRAVVLHGPGLHRHRRLRDDLHQKHRRFDQERRPVAVDRTAQNAIRCRHRRAMAPPAPEGVRQRPDERCIEPPLAPHRLRERPNGAAIPALHGSTGPAPLPSAGRLARYSEDRHHGTDRGCGG
jgi:superfamily II DNA or RNA helicase